MISFSELPDDNWWSDIQKNKFVKMFHSWGELYRIEFELTVTNLPNVNSTNVFHFTTGLPEDDYCRTECARIPAVFIHLGTQSFTSLKADLHQDISKWRLSGTFP